ncbi:MULTISPECIES: type II toxin-antitoxin system RelE/ParE family toxin [unclassified Streptomyces]|uniref:type II toxin-antitoxin system RelE/ParE family toxin n=1 Tax=unclassified Streptomyces TaxID=2593676 RepID=UPI0037F71168
MSEHWLIELEPEVREWLDTLSTVQYRTVERQADRLAASPTTIGEPYSRHLQGPVRELRFVLGVDSVRITYWLAPGRRIVLMTVFSKSRMREEAQVHRAMLKQKECEAEHPPAHVTYDRAPEERT